MTTLEDLRKANLREQRGEAAPAAAKPAEEAAKPAAEPAKAEKPTLTITDLTEHGLAIEDPAPPAPAATAAPKTPAPVPAAKAAPAPKPESQPAPAAEDALGARIRAAVLRKRIIPAGVKATVDMSPELFWRAKRYCHDHNNATLRQLMLETLASFLDEEGY